MDKFMVDLDQVLDDLEAEESRSTRTYPPVGGPAEDGPRPLGVEPSAIDSCKSLAMSHKSNTTSSTRVEESSPLSETSEREEPEGEAANEMPTIHLISSKSRENRFDVSNGYPNGAVGAPTGLGSGQVMKAIVYKDEVQVPTGEAVEEDLLGKIDELLGNTSMAVSLEGRADDEGQVEGPRASSDVQIKAKSFDEGNQDLGSSESTKESESTTDPKAEAKSEINIIAPDLMSSTSEEEAETSDSEAGNLLNDLEDKQVISRPLYEKRDEQVQYLPETLVYSNEQAAAAAAAKEEEEAVKSTPRDDVNPGDKTVADETRVEHAVNLIDDDMEGAAGSHCLKPEEGQIDNQSSFNATRVQEILSFDRNRVEQLTDEELDAYLKDVESELGCLYEDSVACASNGNEPIYHQTISSSEIYPVDYGLDSNIRENGTLSSQAENTSAFSDEAAAELYSQSGCRPTRPSSLVIPSLNNCNETIVPPTVSLSEYSNLAEEDSEAGSDHRDSDLEAPLGTHKPFWIPDNEAPSCMHCDAKFTVIKRRHHCRACGKVLCSQCCNMRGKLSYMDGKEARVCGHCHSVLIKDYPETAEGGVGLSNPDNGLSPSSPVRSPTAFRSPDPNKPGEYCSTVPPLDQAEASLPPPTVLVPVGVLKRGDKPRGEPKQVIFSDGIRPGGDLTEADQVPCHSFVAKQSSLHPSKIRSPPIETVPSPSGKCKSSSRDSSRGNRITISDANGPLPPVINCPHMASEPTLESLFRTLEDEALPPVTFYLTKNLQVQVKLVNLDCCLKRWVWSFASKGLVLVGQDEVAIILEKYASEATVPRDVFRLLTTIFDSATRGSVYSEMTHILFHEGMFGSKENSGFLFIRPTFQCTSKLVLPSPPFLVGIGIHKFEVPWAKVFPLRLLLRLGAEYRYYPCPLVTYRQRKPVYCEIGHTIMNVLADFRNFQYTLSIVPGIVIHIEEKKVTLALPSNRYERIAKVLSNSNEHVLAFGGNFSLEADSHLTCIQNEEGQHQTQTINMEKEKEAPSLTGASFIVFSGALKASTGLTAKMSIVEDGLLIQIPAQHMKALKDSLREMHDYVINCGRVDQEPQEVINLNWVKNDTYFNVGVRSPIDGRSLEGVNSIRIYNGTDYAGNKYLIRWTEVFLIENEENGRRGDAVDPSKLAAIIGQALCLALTPYLDHLVDNGFCKIGLRVTLDPDKIGYDIGSKGTSLPSAYVNELDGALIPVLMGNAIEGLLVMELAFHILIK